MTVRTKKTTRRFFPPQALSLHEIDQDDCGFGELDAEDRATLIASGIAELAAIADPESSADASREFAGTYLNFDS